MTTPPLPPPDLGERGRAAASHAQSVPPAVILGLSITILLDTTAQLVWKAAATAPPAGSGPRQTIAFVLHEPLMYAMVLIWLLQFTNWILVLAKTDLSFAQPVTALSYISVTLVSALGHLHEHVPVTRMVGIGVILLGVWCISTTPHRTRRPADATPATPAPPAPPAPAPAVPDGAA